MSTLDDYKAALRPLTRFGLRFDYRRPSDWQAVFEVHEIAGQTYRVLNGGGWVERDGPGAGPDAASLARLVAHRRARRLARAAETGDARTVCLARLAHEGADAITVTDAHETARMTVCQWRGPHTPWRCRRFKGSVRGIGLALALELEP